MAVIGLINDRREATGERSSTQDNNLSLNVDYTKELIVDPITISLLYRIIKAIAHRIRFSEKMVNNLMHGSCTPDLDLSTFREYGVIFPRGKIP